MAGPYDIFVNIWQSNNFASSTNGEIPRDNGHARIFSMGALSALDGVIYSPAREPLEYMGWQPDGTFPFTVGHILAFCRDYYLPNRLQSGRNILIVQNAMGGTGFQSAENISWRSKYASSGVGGGLHERCIARVNAAMAANPGSVIKACFAQGGEEDAFWVSPVDVNGNPTTYYQDIEAGQQGAGIVASFRDFTIAEVADLRTRWTGGANVPFLFGSPTPDTITHYGYITGPMVALQDMHVYVSNSASIPNTGLSAAPDWQHYNAESQRGSATQTNPLSKRYWTGYQTVEAAEVEATGWQHVKIGGGGFVTGLNISNDGVTMVCRTDVFGALVWNAATSQWDQIIATDRMPPGDTGIDMSGGAWEIKAAPGNSSIIYLCWFGWVFKSTNGGLTFTRPSPGLTRDGDLGGNGEFGGNAFPDRLNANKMAVDPVNPNYVYLGTITKGVWKTADGGTNWTQVPTGSIPFTTNGYSHKIVIDSSSSNVGSGGTLRKSTVYATSDGNGIYRSTDGGTTWAFLVSAPTDVLNMTISAGGVVFCTKKDLSSVHRYDGSWTTKLSGAGGVGYVATHPTSAATVAAVNSGTGAVRFSTDAGVTFGNLTSATFESTATIPWMEASIGSSNPFMSDWCCFSFDPVVAERIWLPHGIGVAYADGVNASATNVGWIDSSIGIELLIVNQLIAPPGGYPVGACWDRALWTFTNPNQYPSSYGPDNLFGYAWGVDYASSDPSFIAAVAQHQSGANASCYSTDKGLTWTKFTGTWDWEDGVGERHRGGSIAVSTPQNMIVSPADNFDPYYTTNGGATWTPVTISGVPMHPAETGWGYAYYMKRHIVAADRVVPNKFYMYNYLGKNIYVSTNGGAAWTLAKAGAFDGVNAAGARLKTVPGKAGHLFFASGQSGGWGDVNPNGDYLYRSTDAGVTWSKVGVQAGGNWPIYEPYDVTFGTVPAGGDYPTVYFIGWYNLATPPTYNFVFGIWRSDDNCITWTKVSDGFEPDGWADIPYFIAADQDVPGKLWLGRANSSFAVLNADAQAPTTYYRPYRQLGRL